MGFLKPDDCKFRNSPVPVTKNLEEFVHIARSEDRPIGLLVKVKRFADTYGELLAIGLPSAWPPIGQETTEVQQIVQTVSSGKPSPFEIRPGSGPCHLICARCEVEFDAESIAVLGPGSPMAALGVSPLNQCQDCGSRDVVIVSAKVTRGR
jgi:DNA-directed RNA polymerase subunit RPC12/RpoP